MPSVCLCMFLRALGNRGKRSAAPPAGGAVSPCRGVQQANRGVPVHPTTQTPARAHTNTRKHRHITPLHPTALQEGVGEGTLHSSKPQLMHNSCTSSNSHILLVGWGEGSEKIKFHYSLHTHL